MLRTLTFAAAILITGPALGARLPSPNELPPVKCWSCDQTIPQGRRTCPGCGAPRDKPKYRDYAPSYESQRYRQNYYRDRDYYRY